MDQDILCPKCGRKLFTIDDNNDVAYLSEKVKYTPRCECGAMPYVGGVRFE